MSLEQFASLAEIIGLLLVFASLIYVARQLNQTTTMMRVSASGERLQRDTDIVNSIVHSREVAEFWMKGATEFQNLDEIDKQRLVFFERRAILHWHNMFGLREHNLVPDSDWLEMKWIIQNIGRRQSIRESWKSSRIRFRNRFRISWRSNSPLQTVHSFEPNRTADHFWPLAAARIVRLLWT
jgi:hypothetical protein